ncbi:hypothetical protein CLAIMM_12951 [Cladophialophora immunda]|nr:hypothetical protein CLAIMM_12951 [Cladophialophora immunda]
MYCQRTPRNQRAVFSMLDNSVSRLASQASSWSVDELLLATQALIFYEIIRLFDAEVGQRDAGERQLAILSAWTKRLQEATTACQEGILHRKSPYLRWVTLESARRTVLISIMVHSVYSLVKDGVCNTVPLMARMPVSLDANLWHMSEQEWCEATSGVEDKLMTYHEYVTKWSHGKLLQDYGAYETILLVACKHNAGRIAAAAL